MKQTTAGKFIILGFTCLLLSLVFGFVASLQYIFPHFLGEHLSFRATRPIHVFLAVNWIFSCVTGIIYHYIPKVADRPLYSQRMAMWHFVLALFTIITAVAGFTLGHFSGREYLDFPPALTIVIIIYWILFAINFLLTVQPKLGKSPVYIWSWCTGLLFFLITMTEAHLWLLPYFNNNLVRDMTVQWKANGSMVGAWNMLIYGSAMYAMEKISGNREIGFQKASYAFYFLGLTNLMFNWGHHTYIIPAHPAVKEVSYLISMTELVLFANIIIKWQRGLAKTAIEGQHSLSIRFFKSADRWILLNLGLAIAISVPYINKYTHGTQITVAHAMGATIGINTMLLLGCVAFIIEGQLSLKQIALSRFGMNTMNISLLIFWAMLITTGLIRAWGTYRGEYFAIIAERTTNYLKIFSVAGFTLAAGTFTIIYLFIKALIQRDAIT
jgi:nitric oxide reductase subunit B